MDQSHLSTRIVFRGLGWWRNEKNNFAADFALGKVVAEFDGVSVVQGFKGLGEFACDADRLVGGEFGEDFESRGEAVRRFEEESGFGRIEGGLELLGSFSFFDVEESVKGKWMRRKAGGDEGGGDGRWAGEDGEGEVFIAACFQETMAGVGEAGGAGVGNDGDGFAIAGAPDEFGDAVLFVVVVE